MTNKKLANAMQDLLTVTEYDPGLADHHRRYRFSETAADDHDVALCLRRELLRQHRGAGGQGQGNRGAREEAQLRVASSGQIRPAAALDGLIGLAPCSANATGRSTERP
jgi:hypothetical protein